jgi:hypothetical protein
VKKRTWVKLVAVVVAVAVVLVVAAPAIVARYFRASPRFREEVNVARSKGNMQMLLTLFLADGRPSPVGGKRLALWLLLRSPTDRTNPKNLEVLFSPGDRELSAEKVSAGAYAALTEESLLDPATDVRRLTSYAGRRSGTPAPTEAGRKPIFADLSFRDRGHVLVAWSDLRVEKLTREDLGLGPDDPIVVGESSKSPVLRMLADE